MPGVLIKMGNPDAKTHTGRTFCRDEHRGEGEALPSPGIQDSRKLSETWNHMGTWSTEQIHPRKEPTLPAS